jgi:hypothetical protein
MHSSSCLAECQPWQDTVKLSDSAGSGPFSTQLALLQDRSGNKQGKAVP